MYENQNIPASHIIQQYLTSGISKKVAVAEFIDNSFGQAAGNATDFKVIQAKDSIAFVDNGEGIKNIDLMFQLGGSDSQYSSSDIGSFGVGSKNGAMSLGSVVTVHTIVNGEYRKHTTDWAECHANNHFPYFHNGEVLPISKAPRYMQGVGTSIVVSKLKSQHVLGIHAVLAEDIGLMFSESLFKGKNIEILKIKSHFITIGSIIGADVIKVQPALTEIALEDETVSCGEVDGKKYSVMAGKLVDGKSKYAGIHVSFGGRIITKLTGVLVPPKLFAMVTLRPSWKELLNFNKTVITGYDGDGRDIKDLLMESVTNELAILIKKLNAEAVMFNEGLFLKDINLKLADGLGALFSGGDNGYDVDPDTNVYHPSGDKKPYKKSDKTKVTIRINNKKKGDLDDKAPSVIEINSLFNNVGNDNPAYTTAVKVADGVMSITINFNQDVPAVASMLAIPINPAFGSVMTSNAVASALTSTAIDIKELIPNLAEVINSDIDDPNLLYVGLFTIVLNAWHEDDAVADEVKNG